MEKFGCNLYQVKKARQARSASEGLLLPTKEKHTRLRLDMAKAEHFLDYMFNSGLLQDVAYGVNRLRFDNGTNLKVANAVLTTKFSHAIMLYENTCEAANYQPLSVQSLFRILRNIKPSQRKCLGNGNDLYALHQSQEISQECDYAPPLLRGPSMVL